MLESEFSGALYYLKFFTVHHTTIATNAKFGTIPFRVAMLVFLTLMKDFSAMHVIDICSIHRITCLHLPYKSRWLYVGTEKGNVHVVNIEKFELSGYTVNWNKAIDIKCKTHPGPVVQITDNPVDSNK
ncbi:predicted protein, partial [Nematostella vectensis]